MMRDPNLKNLAEDILAQVKKTDADAAEVGVVSDCGFEVNARMGDVETLEHHQERSVSLTVYIGKRSAEVSTSDFSTLALQKLIEKAVTMAKITEEDPYSGLPDSDSLAKQFPDLELSHPWGLTPKEVIECAIEAEVFARDQDARLVRSEGVSISTIDSVKVIANSLGFVGSITSSQHQMDCSLVAEENGHMQRDSEYTLSRNAAGLEDFKNVAKRAADKTLARLGARKIKTQTCPILFSPQMAKTLWRHFIAANSGFQLYRQSSFLKDALQKKIFSDVVTLSQQPHLIGAYGSAPFDAEGVATRDCVYVNAGVLEQHILGSYSARKLKMTTTGNAGGVYNFQVTPMEYSFQQMLQEMDTGFLVTELMGQGVNLLTGNYSRGASGFWVENGEIAFPVEEVTIAGNLKDLFQDIRVIGNDIDNRGNIHTGSMLVEKMMVAGS